MVTRRRRWVKAHHLETLTNQVPRHGRTHFPKAQQANSVNGSHVQSAVILASLMTLPQRSHSSLTKRVNCSGVLVLGTKPWAASLS